jgi:hypothetical protein
MTDLAMPELRRALVDAARRQHETVVDRVGEPGGAYARAGRRWRRLRASRWRVVLVVLLVLLGAGAVAYASGLISFGTPAASVPVFANPRAGLGEIAPGTVHLLPISVPDPRGGPSWGMRAISTTRGAGCLQVGRLVDGKLVALGQDGAFGNDGRAHELPVSTNIERLNCSLLDGRRQIFDSVTIKSQAASAAPGVHCQPPGTYPPSEGPTPARCPLADERNLYYGMLGPDARSLTYSVGGQPRTVTTVGPDGAYLIITTGTTHRYTGAAGARERAGLYASDDVPVYSPITAIHYQEGATCHLVTAEQWIYGPSACSPPLPEPYGYVHAGTPTRAQLAAPIHAKLIRGARGRWEIRVSFTSRVAISSLRGEYQLRWHEPGTPRGASSSGSFDSGVSYDYGGMIPQTPNIKAGQTLTAVIDRNPLERSLASGTTSGSVTLRYADGPLIQAEEDTVSVPVGTFQIRVP